MCSATTFHVFVFCFAATLKLTIPSMNNPQITLTMIADDSSSSNTGTINVDAITNFEKKVEAVDSHISFAVCLFSASSEI